MDNKMEIINRDAGPLVSMKTADLVAHVDVMRDVISAVMKEGVHYGKIPGCGDKPALYKSGAEIGLMTFGLAVTDVAVEDLSTADAIRYRVRTFICTADGIVRGVGIGEASSDEEKYKWRAAICPEEFEAFAANRKRIKYRRDYDSDSGFETVQQVRTEPADIANTVLKMAKKRSLVDGTLTTTACSSFFTQDADSLAADLATAEQPPERKTPLSGKFKGAGGNGGPKGPHEIGKVQNVETYNGTAKGSGKPYTIYKIKVNGKEHKTFSDTILAQAEGAKEGGLPVTVTYKDGKFGRDVETFEVGSAEPEKEAESPADDKPAATGNAARINAAQEEFGLSDTAVDGMISDLGLPPDPADWQAQDVARVVSRMKASK